MRRRTYAVLAACCTLVVTSAIFLVHITPAIEHDVTSPTQAVQKSISGGTTHRPAQAIAPNAAAASGSSHDQDAASQRPPVTDHPRLPIAAVRIARRYATASFSTVAGAPSDAWVDSVAPLCSSAWRRHLELATNDVVRDAFTDRPSVKQTFASWAPAGDVAVTVLLLDPRTGGFDAIYIALTQRDGHYLVVATQ